MQPNLAIKEEADPRGQLLLTFVYAAVGVVVGLIIGIVVVIACYGVELIEDLSWITGTNPKYFGALKIILVAQQIGLFLVPPFALAYTEQRTPKQFYGLGNIKIDLLLLVFLIMLCSVPLLGWINEINHHMKLGPWLKDIEEWMRAKEAEAEVTTNAILKMKNVWDLLISLFVVGLVPAVCEEFFFRGIMQRTFLRMFKNPHIGIWTVAIIFSAIHLQFFGFFPRLILGALFGYIYFWTGSLKYTMFAHFLNNGYAVLVTYFLSRNNISASEADDINFAWYGYVISAGITLALLLILYRKTKQ